MYFTLSKFLIWSVVLISTPFSYIIFYKQNSQFVFQTEYMSAFGEKEREKVRSDGLVPHLVECNLFFFRDVGNHTHKQQQEEIKSK